MDKSFNLDYNKSFTRIEMQDFDAFYFLRFHDIRLGALAL